MTFSVFMFVPGGYAAVLLAAMLVLETTREPVAPAAPMRHVGEDGRLRAWSRLAATARPATSARCRCARRVRRPGAARALCAASCRAHRPSRSQRPGPGAAARRSRRGSAPPSRRARCPRRRRCASPRRRGPGCVQLDLEALQLGAARPCRRSPPGATCPGASDLADDLLQARADRRPRPPRSPRSPRRSPSRMQRAPRLVGLHDALVVDDRLVELVELALQRRQQPRAAERRLGRLRVQPPSSLKSPLSIAKANVCSGLPPFSVRS